TENLLVELFVEELPPKALRKLGDAFAAELAAQLASQGLTASDTRVTAFASPRRLAAHITRVWRKAEDRAVQQKLMPVSVGLDAAGQPTPALLKKLAALGADLSDPAQAVAALKRATDGKAEALFYDNLITGATLDVGLQKALDEAIAKLPIPKVMSYQLETDCELPGWSSVNFVRPAHGLVALHGSAIVPVKALGLSAGQTTRGHRFEAKSPMVHIPDADSYAEVLRSEGAVIASFAERKAEIASQLAAAAAQIGGGVTPIEDDALLDEVAALVERPKVLVCQFEKEFLGVPQECLILTMKANQKYFPLLDAQGRLTHQFLVVSNINPADPSAVIGGNERVVRPRLADAKFFFDQDRKKTLESRVEGLGRVVYHNKLGTQGERVERVRSIARWVASQVGGDTQLADRAALLAKADLLTDMVGEFPELQGIMGGYYSRHDGENALVAQAITDQYVLNRSDTADAENHVSAALVLADRCETLVGIWGIGLKPTGEKDPFALRRHALTVLKTMDLLSAASVIAGQPAPLALGDLLQVAKSTFKDGLLSDSVVGEVGAFTYERYTNQIVGLYDANTVDAVLSLEPPIGQQTIRRIDAVRAFAALPEAAALAAANKRIGNILKKAGEVDAHVSEVLLQDEAEKALYTVMQQVVPQADALFDAGDYTASLCALAALRGPVDAFFDGVMVNA
ncbi:MAG: glycine--tRNA ligase subunit beta, partial [Hylemonella sp.]|nr:glycine--tRNA ligase subunit beta [Hylemonella sp.]